jgi:hypothetical protein
MPAMPLVDLARSHKREPESYGQELKDRFLAYKAKMPKHCQQFAMYTPEQQQARSANKKPDA